VTGTASGPDTVLAQVSCRVFGGAQGRGLLSLTMMGLAALLVAIAIGVPAPVAALVFLVALGVQLRRLAGTASYSLGAESVTREYRAFSGREARETRPFTAIKAWKYDREMSRSLQEYEYLELDFRDGSRWIITSRQDAASFATFRAAFTELVRTAKDGADEGLAAARRRPSFYRTWYGRGLAIVLIVMAGSLGLAAGAGLIALTGLFKLLFVILPGAVYMGWRSFRRESAKLLLLALALGAPVEAQQRSARASASVEVPAGMQYVASSRGQVYYWVGCDAWRSLARANLRFFATRDAALAAGYRVSGTAGCAGPSAPAAPASPRADTRTPSGGRELPCVVDRVIDGDTLECRGGRRVRFLLVDTPELSQRPYGPQAKAFVESRVPRGTAVTLELDVQERDRYDRTLAYVRLPDGSVINELLLTAGFALVEVYPPNVRHVDRYRELLKEAQAAKRGLWATSAFECSPADNRRGRCE
jgi:endonuclease YncB( thermonuclease family)